MKVQFYILQQSAPLLFERQLFRLCYDLYRAYQHVLILCEDESQCQHLNEALWTVKPEYFLPHEVLGPSGKAKTSAPVLLTLPGMLPPSPILINCTALFPAQVDRYPNIIELIPHDENKKTLARSRYKQYQHPDRRADLHCHFIQDLVE
jgi:DNA polymerase-3 subunit chi